MRIGDGATLGKMGIIKGIKMPDKISKHMIKPLFIFELANNHCGNLEHGLTIIRKFHDTVKEYKEFFNFGFKLQYRHLDTFIHPDFKDRNDIKYVKRFLDTRLAPVQFKMLKDEFQYPAMLIVVVITIVAASYFHLGLGWVVLIASPFALFLAWKKAQKT